MDQQLDDLYHRFVGRAFDRQLRLAEFQERKAPGEDWDFDTESAILNFGPKLQFVAPMVGSHAHHNDSWMWSWANRTIKLSITNRALGDTIRAMAHRAMVPEFAKNAFPLEPLIGEELTRHAVHFFGSILVGELDYDGYFVAPYDGGQALLLLRDDRLRVNEKHPLARVLSVFPQAIAALPVPNHRDAFTNYVRSYGLTFTEEGGQVKVTGSEKGELTATFDERGRLTSLVGTGIAMPKPRPTAPKKKVKPKKKPVPMKAKKKVVKAKAKKPVPAKKVKPTVKPKAKPVIKKRPSKR